MLLPAVAVGAAFFGFGVKWIWDRMHAVPPGALSYGPGMYGLDQGIPPEVAVAVYDATQVEVFPAKLRDFAVKTAALAKERNTAWPLAVHVLNERADYLTAKDRRAGLK